MEVSAILVNIEDNEMCVLVRCWDEVRRVIQQQKRRWMIGLISMVKQSNRSRYVDLVYRDWSMEEMG